MMLDADMEMRQVGTSPSQHWANGGRAFKNGMMKRQVTCPLAGAAQAILARKLVDRVSGRGRG
eukprot:3821821-Rhodomonas_salina.6